VKTVTMTMVMSAMMKRAMTMTMMLVTSNPRLWPAPFAGAGSSLGFADIGAPAGQRLCTRARSRTSPCERQTCRRAESWSAGNTGGTGSHPPCFLCRERGSRGTRSTRSVRRTARADKTFHTCTRGTNIPATGRYSRSACEARAARLGAPRI
jgi:hypothetical protein